jgi:hypothetical protein
MTPTVRGTAVTTPTGGKYDRRGLDLPRVGVGGYRGLGCRGGNLLLGAHSGTNHSRLEAEMKRLLKLLVLGSACVLGVLILSDTEEGGQ